jgi:hypothetical protein
MRMCTGKLQLARSLSVKSQESEIQARISAMTKTFKARIKSLDSALGWRIVDIPFDVKKAFGKGGRVPVRGTVNGFAFRTSLFPRKEDKHFLMLNKQMQKGAGATLLEDAVEVVLELDTEKRTVGTPTLLKKALDDDEDLLKYFNSFSYYMRKWIGEYITLPKSEATRRKRAEQMAVTLMEMRDGEIEPPPFLKAEFAHNPKAKIGWEKMPPSQRRGHLWGVLYYRSPESRRKRLEKAIEQMVAYANKS